MTRRIMSQLDPRVPPPSPLARLTAFERAPRASQASPQSGAIRPRGRAQIRAEAGASPAHKIFVVSRYERSAGVDNSEYELRQPPHKNGEPRALPQEVA